MTIILSSFRIPYRYIFLYLVTVVVRHVLFNSKFDRSNFDVIDHQVIKKKWIQDESSGKFNYPCNEKNYDLQVLLRIYCVLVAIFNLIRKTHDNSA